jgi:hypothetical protein
MPKQPTFKFKVVGIYYLETGIFSHSRGGSERGGSTKVHSFYFCTANSVINMHIIE